MNLLKITSISKKVTLALVGLFLIIFLLVHLGINLCLLRSDSGAWFYNATQFMGSNYIVKVFEIVLFAAIFIHICLAIALQIQNWRSRPVRYKITSKSKTSFMSRYMIWTGGLILCFLVLHFINFYFVKIGFVEGKYMVKMEHVEQYMQKHIKEYQELEKKNLLTEEAYAELQERFEKIQALDKEKTAETQKIFTNLTKKEIADALGSDFHHYEPDFYVMAKELFTQKAYSIIYIVLFFVLGFHLYHAFQSAFQTLGLNHNKYNGTIKTASLLYTVFIVAGFSIIPLYYMFFFKH